MTGGVVKKNKYRKSYIKIGTALVCRLSFVIVVKGGEWLDVSINAKGEDC